MHYLNTLPHRAQALLGALGLVCITAGPGCDLPGTDDDDDAGADTDGGDDGDADTGTGGDDGDDGDGGSDGSDGSDDTGSDTSDPDGETGSTPGGPLTCSTASLFAGSPNHTDPTLRPDEGTGILEDPPLGWRNLDNDGSILYSNVGTEVWSTDLSEASPVLNRVAGNEFGGGDEFTDGACDDARFANLAGVAVMSNGDLIVTDGNANAVLQIVDPQGEGCTVNYVAGTSEPQASVSPADPPNGGEEDGPGLGATFRLPKWPAVGADDTVYVVDTGNLTIRAIANDADRTVSTIADLKAFSYETTFGMVELDGKLYVIAQEFSGAAILEVDIASGEVSELVAGGGDVWLEDGNSGVNPSGIATDGQSLIVVNHAKVFEITTDGDMTHIAGNGEWQSYSPGYDPLAEHDAFDLELRHRPGRAATAHANAFAHYMDGALLYVGTAGGEYIERIECAR